MLIDWFSVGTGIMHFETVTLLFIISTNMVALCTDEVRVALLPYNAGPSSAVYVIFKLYAISVPAICVQNVKLSRM